jgi:hypothetical protein
MRQMLVKNQNYLRYWIPSNIGLNARTNYLIPTIPLFVNEVSQASIYLHDYLRTLCWGAVSVDPSAVAVGFNTHSYLMPVA